MMEQRRGKNVAIAGTVLQAAFTAVLLVIWLWTGSVAAMAATWLLAAGIAAWLLVTVLFYCRELAAREGLELEEIAARSQGATIFESEDEENLRPAGARARWMERWVVPVFTLAWAALHAAIGVLTLRYLSTLDRLPDLGSAAPGALFAVLITFVAFLFSRYSTGMGTQAQWRLLRATGSYLLVNVLAIAGVAAALLAATQNYARLDRVVAYVVPAVQLVLAAELLVNFVLDLYRPRVPGREHRVSFDSRLCNLVAQPERVGHSIAETLNYQFGFEVSGTWFYQLLSKAMVPLIVLGAVILLAMSSIVIVHEGQEAIVFHWGRPTESTLRAGVHLKWPWPVDRVEMFDTETVRVFTLGAGMERSEEERARQFIKGREIFLWTSEHGEREELDFLVARPEVTRPASEDQNAPPVDIIKLVVPVRYRVTDVYKYGYRAADTHRLLESLAYREMVQYCASATLTEPLPGGENDGQRPEAIMTYGREQAVAELQDRIQKVADRLDLGVEIIYTGMVAVHPPPSVAPEYEKVLEAERRRDEKRYRAQGVANEMLAQVAGTPGDARRLALKIRRLAELQKLQDRVGEPAEMIEKLRAETDRTRSDLQAVQREIRREMLLGQVSQENILYEKELQAYLDLLGEIAEEGGDFQFAEAIAEARREADDLFDRATGTPAVKVAQAKAYRWATEMKERGNFESFAAEMFAYLASPEVYMLDRFLDVWDEVLPGMRKYVLAVDRDKVQVRINWEQQEDLMQGAYEGGTGR